MDGEWRITKEDKDYDVSSFGRVRSWKNNRHGRASTPKVLTPGLTSAGYPSVCLSGKTYTVHRLVANNFLGAKPEDHVHHKDGVRANFNLDNLEILSPLGHRGMHPSPSGERHYQGKLTWDDVDRIRSLRGVVPQWKLAKEYNVHQVTVSEVQLQKIWKDRNAPPK